tara:strand:+ start:54983 stop:55798 length:816 start_codon:yes stop_codon:yes gene_type:complete
MLNTAVKAARRAGAIINRATLDPTKIKISEKEKNDFVTNIDKNCEQEIIDILLSAYPKHSILAEESGTLIMNPSNENINHGYTWIVDPIDGTTNFIHDFPFYSVSIGLMLNGEITQAVVYDPHRDELFISSKGRGSYLNDRRLRVSNQIIVEGSLITTGFPPKNKTNYSKYINLINKLVNNSVSVRRIGSAALELCYVAAGRSDCFFEIGLMPWDIAAGSLIVKEAGGFVGDFIGGDGYLFNGDIVASNPKLFPIISKLIASEQLVQEIKR